MGIKTSEIETVGAAIDLNIEALNHYIEDKCGGKEYFFGAWSVTAFSVNTPKLDPNIQLKNGSNWFALRNGAEVVDGIIFPKSSGNENQLTVFRGYLAEENIHSYSDPNRVKDYWSEDIDRRHNGVFCSVTISPDGSELTIITDLIGIGPIFIRRVDDFVFFASTPALLAMEDDSLDQSAWFNRIFNGNIPGRNTLIEQIRMPEHASITTFTKQGMEQRYWLNPNDLPNGEKPVKADTINGSEKVFAKVMKRCESLAFGKTVLTFSSGFDSRRILAHLMKDQVTFESCLMQMPDADGFDVDAPCAEIIAKDYKFPYKIFDYPSEEKWLPMDYQRLYSLDALSQFHTWSVPFFDHYSGQKISVYDGMGGDLFGYNGWIFFNHIKKMLPNAPLGFLKPGALPTYDQVTAETLAFQNRQPEGPNQAMLTFALWQTRKATSTWGTQQAKPGQLFLYPYFDLDYIEEMLSYALPDKDMFKPQREILHRFWPTLAKYKGSRDMPMAPANIGEQRNKNEEYVLKHMTRELHNIGGLDNGLGKMLTFKARVILFLSQYFSVFPRKTIWWTKQVVEVFLWWKTRPFVIRIRSGNK